MAVFSQTEVEAITNALGDTNLGLMGNEIAHLLQTLRIADPDPTYSKHHRLLNALAADQNKRQNRKGILAFIRRALAPARWLGKRDDYEPLRARLNEALGLMGLVVGSKKARPALWEKQDRAVCAPEAWGAKLAPRRYGDDSSKAHRPQSL
jgi:hypothetical protein